MKRTCIAQAVEVDWIKDKEDMQVCSEVLIG